MQQLRRHVWLAALLLAPSFTFAATANPYLSQAKVFHQGLDFEKCLKRLTSATNWKANVERDFVDIELYQALCELGLGREKEATAHFETALRIDKNLELPPLQSPRVTALFKKVKERVVGVEPEPVPPVAVAQPAPSVAAPVDVPKPVALEPVPAPAAAVVVAPAEPPRPKLGAALVLGGVGVAATATAIALGLTATSTAAKANAAPFQVDALALGQDARSFALGSNIAWGAAGACVVAAVITYVVQNAAH